MKLVNYRAGGEDKYGIVSGDGVIDAAARLESEFPTLRDVLDAGALDKLAAIAGEAPDSALDDIEFELPVPNARKIMCAGRNYRAYHEVAEEGKTPDWPSVFSRFATSFVPHRGDVLKPKDGDWLDYEGELVAVIGKRGRHIAEADALGHVAGYTIMNEGTLRDWSKRGLQNMPSKNFFHSGALGPWIVTADEIPDPQNLRLTTRRDGAVVQDGTTDRMIFTVAFLIAYMSKVTWLEPGDMISTGSPGGSITENKNPKWLQPGETLEIEVSGIGTLSHGIAKE